VFGIFAALTEFERELIRERTLAGLQAARARGRKGGRKFSLSKAQVRLAQAAMHNRDAKVSELCEELGIARVTLYRYVSPDGELRTFCPYLSNHEPSEWGWLMVWNAMARGR
jgi:DNA invertase Pin-like site-specific DNA recombinase